MKPELYIITLTIMIFAFLAGHFEGRDEVLSRVLQSTQDTMERLK